MKKCDCYRTKIERRHTYHITSEPIYYDAEVSVCDGTRERDECSCGGDRTKCDFYPEVRKKALKEQEPKFGEWISVEDRLPEERDVENKYWDSETFAILDVESQLISDDVLVVVKDTEREHTFVTFDCTVDGKWQNWDNGYYEVTHWMPTPPPPIEKP